MPPGRPSGAWHGLAAVAPRPLCASTGSSASPRWYRWRERHRADGEVQAPSARARERWPDLAGVDVRFRGARGLYLTDDGFRRPATAVSRPPSRGPRSAVRGAMCTRLPVIAPITARTSAERGLLPRWSRSSRSRSCLSPPPGGSSSGVSVGRPRCSSERGRSPSRGPSGRPGARHISPVRGRSLWPLAAGWARASGSPDLVCPGRQRGCGRGHRCCRGDRHGQRST